MLAPSGASRAGVGEIANNFPASILLPLEDVHPRLERTHRIARPRFRFIQCPNQSDNSNITVDQDFSQTERVVRAMRCVAQQAAQPGAYFAVTSIRNLAKLITKIFREDGADLICLASVVRLCPGIEFCSNSRSSFLLCQCGKGPREQHGGTSRPPHERVHHSLTLHFVCPLHPLTLQQGSLCRCFLRNICDLVQTLANQPNM